MSVSASDSGVLGRDGAEFGIEIVPPLFVENRERFMSNVERDVPRDPGAIRRQVVLSAKTLIVKIGTNVLSRPDDTLDLDRIAGFAEQLHRVRQGGRKVVVVSSGAIGAGIGLLGLKTRPSDLPHLQASAAVGQAHLIRRYDDCLQKFGYHAAQLLLTANDFKQRKRYLNVRNTLYTLFEYPVIPVINENDTVSVNEIKFGDNDILAAMVAHLLPAPMLVILSIVDGLFNGDPASPDSQRIPLVEAWDDGLENLALPIRSTRGTGGMQSKLSAVRTATEGGVHVVIADGTRPAVIDEIMAGDDRGTLFMGSRQTRSARQRWIGYTLPPKGRLQLDEGARKAVADSGKSLLAAGISRVEGDFGKGELVALTDPAGNVFARGLTNYSAADLRKIAGQRTSQIVQILGNMPYEEVIHRDNLVVIE